ncbi:H-NS family nucleoid-associated regulatory protein [Pseudooceanicola marinus]|uniref:H-NS histone family protein n=1 Tax=Pseudooceanicola marinus TaxID=396013 RepID=UPI001C963CF5|nr:H-NS histone family protein [Pseudooceanicola marinus]MBY5973274.1 H-NS histone family protein [Ferrimonas balearica]MCA1336950.1 H-NS histone family protein [Pseudooceanicola marinus]
MLDIDLDTLSLGDLKKLQARVSTAIKTYEERQRKAALVELEAKAAEMGFSLSELTGQTGRKAKVNPPKYRNPEDGTQTWSGRGRQPAWIKEALARGESLDTFLIVK